MGLLRNRETLPSSRSPQEAAKNDNTQIYNLWAENMINVQPLESSYRSLELLPPEIYERMETDHCVKKLPTIARAATETRAAVIHSAKGILYADSVDRSSKVRFADKDSDDNAAVTAIVFGVRTKKGIAGYAQGLIDGSNLRGITWRRKLKNATIEIGD